MALSHLTYCPQKCLMFSNTLAPENIPKPNRYIWPVLIRRVVKVPNVSCSQTFALENIPTRTGLCGPFSF